jgi:putative toxin-antitoxin system antitoxin component (TIGR02293 family)
MVKAAQAPAHSKQRSQQLVPPAPQAPLRYQSILEFAEQFPLSREDIKTILAIPASTQFRYQKENPILKPAIADRFERLRRIYQQALELFEDETETKRWLSTPHDGLERKTPLQAIATDSGTKQVEAILYRAEYGMFG